MYRAKRAGADRIEIFNADDAHREGRARPALEGELRRAIEKKQLQARLPADLLSAHRDAGRLRGPGALGASARSARSTPPTSCPSPRRSDLIVKLGSYVLARAVREAARWQRELPRPDAPAVRRRQRLEPAAVPAGAGQGGAPHPRPRRHPEGLAAARDHRVAASWRTRRRRPRCCEQLCRRRRRPGARRLRHRLLVALLPQPVHLRHHQDRPLVPAGERARTAPARSSCARSWRWPTSSARTSWPRASRPRRTSASCARSAASTGRASTTASP